MRLDVVPQLAEKEGGLHRDMRVRRARKHGEAKGLRIFFQAHCADVVHLWAEPLCTLQEQHFPEEVQKAAAHTLWGWVGPGT